MKEGSHMNNKAWRTKDMTETYGQATRGELIPTDPDLGHIEGSTSGLFYYGKVNGLAGDSGAGKSWIALNAAHDTVKEAGTVLWIDYEDTQDTLAVRMFESGWTEDEAELVFHINASGPLTDGMPSIEKVIRRMEADREGVHLVIIDSAGEAMAASGVNSNSDEDVAQWFQEGPRAIAAMGPGVLLLDHMVKSPVEGSGLWPIGSHRKRAAIDGVQYVARIKKPFSRRDEGSVQLLCAKDRGGVYTAGQTVSEVFFTPDGAGNILVEPTVFGGQVQAGDERPIDVMEKISKLLEKASNPLSKKVVGEKVRGKTTTVRVALDILVDEGYVKVTKGERNSMLHTSIKPYRQTEG